MAISTDGPSQEPTSAPPPPARRGRGTVADMVRSLGAVILVALVVVWLLPRDDAATVREVDYGFAADQARIGSPFEVLVPDFASEEMAGWRVTSARSGRTGTSVTWHLGLLTPSGRYAAVEQSEEEPSAMLERFGLRSTDETVTVDGQAWTRAVGNGADRGLWREFGPSTVLILGDAPEDELVALVESLRPR